MTPKSGTGVEADAIVVVVAMAVEQSVPAQPNSQWHLFVFVQT